jgi:tripartite-type tricarboxylate transporter receptor subunit TctC
MKTTFAAIAAAAACAGSPAVLGQGAASYPSKPIRIIVPFTPGSATDVMGRIVGERLTAAWGQPVVVDNRPGAGGVIGIRETARAEPDGYTVVVVSSGHAVNHTLYKDLQYDTLKDFAGVALLGTLPSVLIVPPSLGVNSVKELVAMLKAKPGEYNYATAGVGSGAHVSTEKFNVATGVKAVHVPLKGTPPMLAETMAHPVRLGAGGVEHGAGQGRQGEAARGEHAEADRRAAGRADDRRGRLPQRRVQLLGRDARAGEDAEGHRREAERRGEPRAPVAGSEGPPGEARHRTDGDDARAVRQIRRR